MEAWASRQLALGLGFPIWNVGEFDETGNSRGKGLMLEILMEKGPGAAQPGLHPRVGPGGSDLALQLASACCLPGGGV